VLNIEAALFALEHAGEFARQAEVIKSERERLMAALAKMPGARAFPSQANMILVRVNDAAGVFNALKARGILIKNVAGLHQLLANCVRLTVGLPAENDALIVALADILREPLNVNPA
jgi:histidinol-phosphate aminotransferase